MAQLLNGQLCAQKQEEALKQRLLTHWEQGHGRPALIVLQIGDDRASTLYIQRKEAACARVGITFSHLHFRSDIALAELQAHLKRLSHDPSVHGILLQMPLPAHLPAPLLFQALDPKKDVDGLHPLNMGQLLEKNPLLRPCTPYGIIRLLEYYQLSLSGRHAVIIGSSTIVGRPMALEALLAEATVTICHRKTADLKKHSRRADLLIVAAGCPGLIGAEDIQDNAIIVDVGINRLANGHICGDVDFASVFPKAGWISPVPGGVGPMTIAMLLENTLLCFEQSLSQGFEGISPVL